MLENFLPKLIMISRLSGENTKEFRRSYGRRTVQFWELELITDGRGEIITEGQSIRTEAGRLFLRRPGIEVEGFTPYHSYFLRFWDANSVLDELSFPLFLDHMEYLTDYFKIIRKNFISPEITSELEITAALCSIFSAVIRSGKKNLPAKIQESVQKIREHPEKACTVTALAEESGYSLNHYIRLFKEASGRTPAEFIRFCRVQKACALLEETNAGIDRIAQSCGFENLSYFFRTFKALKKQTPGEYRENVRIYR